MWYQICRMLAAVLLFYGGLAQAQLAVDRIIIDIAPDAPPREDVRLSNSSETETLYIQVEVLEVDNPGTPNEQRKVVDDPAAIGMIASPTRLVIPPGSSQLVRLVSLLPSDDRDQIFRVNFTPVTGELVAEETSVKIMVGYQALVIVRPNEPEPDVQAIRKGNILTLTNRGNTNVYLDAGRECKTGKLEECTVITGNRLYSGNSWDIELEGDGPVAFNIYDGERTVQKVF